MKKIKGTFNYSSSHTHLGSHRTSNGFKYNYEDVKDVAGPFFNQVIPLSYQDLIKLRNFATDVQAKYYSCEEGYEWAECYTPDESYDRGEDFGLCQFFNENYSQQYDLVLVSGSLDDCTMHLDDMPPLKSFAIAYNDALELQKKQRDEIQYEINKIARKLQEYNHKLQKIDSSESFQSILLRELYAPLKGNIHLFELNETFYANLFPLDVAISNHDEALLDNLIINGAYQYSSEFDPKLSARCGNFRKVYEVIKKNELSNIDILNVFELIISLPDSEFYSIFNTRLDLVRNGRLLLTNFSKLRLFVRIRTYYLKRGYQSPFDIEPFKIICENLMINKDFTKSNFVYDFSKQSLYFTGFDESDMLKLSFEYGNLDYINRRDLWNLVNAITERFSYSYTLQRLEYDRFGKILKIRSDFELYVKPEIIGQELYDKIIDQIENNSQAYTCW